MQCQIPLHCMVCLRLYGKGGFTTDGEAELLLRIGWCTQWIAFSRFLKSLLCQCLVFVCCVSPPGEQQTFLHVEIGHGQQSIKSNGGGERGWETKLWS